jgi:hypothetical protein
VNNVAIKFEDNRIKVSEKLNDKAVKFLIEAKNSLVSQTQRNTPVDTGDLKRSFGEDSYIDEKELTAYIGSRLEYAIWVEMGTGEYAVEGNGRKGGWVYTDDKGERHFTKGMKPKRMMYNAYKIKKAKIQQQAENIYREMNNI